MAANPYDPITTTDSTQLADDDWGLSLPPLRYKSYRDSRLKYICSELRQHSKCVIVTLCSLCLIILISVIIGVAASGRDERHPTGQEPAWTSKTTGLVFYPIPEDKTIVISYKSGAAKQLIKSLENSTIDYLPTNQVKENFVNCNESFRPFNETCRVSRIEFGNECSLANNFGYDKPQPCVFIQLNLPDNRMIVPITSSSPLWEKASSVMKDHQDTAHIPVTCTGSEPEDVERLNKAPLIGKERISYFPKDGLASYIYRNRNQDVPFVKPALMVLFTSLRTNQLVHVTCTAWGQLMDFDQKPIKHELLTAQFAVYIK